MTDDEIQTQAIEFARLHKKDIAKRLTDTAIFRPESIPVSVFMAGSPGAGKTESARSLIEKFSKNTRILHIDPDTLREEFEAYNGVNSRLFQGATSIVADKMQDLAINQSQSFVFDGTLANRTRAEENIKRSLNHNREVFIVYVYQDPLQAWKFVKARELQDGRSVPEDAFIEKYFLARQNVNQLKERYGRQLQVDVIVKNIDGTDFMYKENVDVIDNFVPERYSTDSLREIINR